MATKEFINTEFRPNVKLKITELYLETLYNEILPFTLENWGAVVMIKLLKEIDNSILRLYSMPDANPKDLYIDSTATKTYRNIILSKYPYKIIYSKTKNNVVTVYNIIHQNVNPKRYKTLIKQIYKK